MAPWKSSSACSPNGYRWPSSSSMTRPCIWARSSMNRASAPGGSPILLLSIVSGALADRLPKKRLLIITQAVLGGQALLLGALVYVGHVEYWHVAVLATGVGLANVLDSPARQSLVAEMVGRADVSSAISLNSACFNAARIVGPSIGGVVIARYGVAPAFVMNAIGFVISIAIAYFYRTYWALLIGTVAAQFISTAVSYMVLPYRPRVGFRHFRDLMSFSIWLTGGQIVNTLNWRFDYLLIGRALGMSALGHYSVGSTLAQIPTRETTGPLTKVIYPGFSSIRGNPGRLAAAYQRAQALITAIALPAGFGAALIADTLIRLAMGEKWEPVILVVQVLAAVFALQTLGSLSEPLGMAQGETKLLFKRNVQMLLVRVPLIVAGMLVAGLKGVLIARMLSGLFSIFLAMRLVRRFTGLDLRQQLGANMRSLLSVAAMVGAVVLVSPLLVAGTDTVSLLIRIIVIGAVASLVYCGTSFVLWIAMHRPSGPEREVQLLVGKMLTKLRMA